MRGALFLFLIAPTFSFGFSNLRGPAEDKAHLEAQARLLEATRVHEEATKKVEEQRKVVAEARERELKLKAMIKDLEENDPRKGAKSFAQQGSQLGLLAIVLAMISFHS